MQVFLRHAIPYFKIVDILSSMSWSAQFFLRAVSVPAGRPFPDFGFQNICPQSQCRQRRRVCVSSFFPPAFFAGFILSQGQKPCMPYLTGRSDFRGCCVLLHRQHLLFQYSRRPVSRHRRSRSRWRCAHCLYRPLPAHLPGCRESVYVR